MSYNEKKILTSEPGKAKASINLNSDPALTGTKPNHS